eukprot:scaffold862_cov216-Pinguiococcus_pyrenoidosus.AAC.2
MNDSDGLVSTWTSQKRREWHIRRAGRRHIALCGGAGDSAAWPHVLCVASDHGLGVAVSGLRHHVWRRLCDLRSRARLSPACVLAAGWTRPLLKSRRDINIDPRNRELCLCRLREWTVGRGSTCKGVAMPR